MPKPQKKTKKEDELDLGNRTELFDFFYNTKKPEDIGTAVGKYLNKIIEKSKLNEKYEIIFLYDPNRSIRDYTADQIYKALPKEGEKKRYIVNFI